MFITIFSKQCRSRKISAVPDVLDEFQLIFWDHGWI
jgi:hypothetical protein